MFSGCGGADIGMVAAGYESIGGVEYHQPAADIYNLNHTHPITVADILSIDSIPTVDLLWISPPCPSFSIVNANRGETDNDRALAHHLAKLIKGSRPNSIAIENVRGYAQSQSLAIILATLLELGYEVRQSIECAANYGCPTTRERLIVRASMTSIRELIPTHQKPADQLTLFTLPNWVSWWDAIADFAHDLPRSKLTENQSKILQQQELKAPLLVNGDGNRYGSAYTTRTKNLPAPTITASIAKHPMRILVDVCNPRGGEYTIRSSQQPSHTITAKQGSRVSSNSKILVERVGYYNGNPHIYPDTVPAPTIRASQHIDGFRGSYRVAYNIVDDFDCFAADIRCLAAWQGFENYKWGSNRGEAGRAIGNAVVPAVSAAVARSFSN
jgi:DNA-cytosine methyltransferase